MSKDGCHAYCRLTSVSVCPFKRFPFCNQILATLVSSLHNVRNVRVIRILRFMLLLLKMRCRTPVPVCSL
jgi:hypothetical protein